MSNQIVYNSKNNENTNPSMHRSKSQQISANIQNHLLKDYTFLHDYIIIDLELPHSRSTSVLDQSHHNSDGN